MNFINFDLEIIAASNCHNYSIFLSLSTDKAIAPV